MHFEVRFIFHLSQEVCTCRRLQEIMHLGGVHLQKAAKANRSTQV